MTYLQTESLDLLFLDVEMPGITGIDLIRNMDHLPLVIFISAKKEYAADAFEYRDLVIDFITKPVTLPRLVNSVNKARQIQLSTVAEKSHRDYMFIKSEGRLVRIDYKDLLYLETVGDYVLFKTSGKQHLVHSSLKKIDARLSHPDFMKVHRSYIINLSKIIDFEDNSVLIGKKIIPVSRAFKAELYKRLSPL
jgi:DNA-binding LytR/AlgR family response regulator